MTSRFRVPMFVVAAALLGLIALLATLQYRWLGQISAAERERMKANLSGRTSAFAQEFDREITRAYLTFQVDVLQDVDTIAGRIAASHERWQATARYPRLIEQVYVIQREDSETSIRRFNPSSRFLEPVEWPAGFDRLRSELAPAPPTPAGDGVVMVRANVATVHEEIPAIVVPTPILLFDRLRLTDRARLADDVQLFPLVHYTVLALDREYIASEVLPQLAQQHFRGATEGTDYDLAVVSAATSTPVYATDPQFTPDAATEGDATADLFQVRVQENAAMAAEVRRSLSFFARTFGDRAAGGRGPAAGNDPATTHRLTVAQAPPLSIVLQHSVQAPEGGRGIEATAASLGRPAPAAWRMVVKHPSGSLETAVASVRRRNLLVSSGILAVLGASVAFLVVTTRRAQDLARQQMEFVAAVSHELCTPLAVIRSAADNLAEGIVRGEEPVRRYGELVRGEGRRLSEMVEQILELAGIQSGQRGFALRPVAVVPLLHDVVRASEPLLREAGLQVEYGLADTLPPALGDEPALRRVFQNLVGNAIKYGADGGRVELKARADGREILVTIADHGIGIEPSEQENIFKPFYRAPGVIAAQIQGAGLGLSLVQRIVEAHGGRVTVQSAPGQGSAFTVHLPAASEEPLPTAASAHDPAPSGARG